MATDVDTILKLSVPLLVMVGERKMSVEDVLSLGPGAILELERPADSDLILMVNNKTIGSGQAVKVGENFGIKITHIDSAADRITAMGGDGSEE
ncbi:MAG: FliM/FliN family flagellar motor switch protein [Gammaproteobacteria bacterium]|nr:MAG: FliM/FliN family flagellar motor switch protein [Gammaproteobacteria bacterium]